MPIHLSARRCFLYYPHLLIYILQMPSELDLLALNTHRYVCIIQTKVKFITCLYLLHNIRFFSTTFRKNSFHYFSWFFTSLICSYIYFVLITLYFKAVPFSSSYLDENLLRGLLYKYNPCFVRDSYFFQAIVVHNT